MVSASSLVTGILTSLVIFLVCLVVYGFLARRPSLNVIYYPAKLLANLPPPSNYLGQGPLSWAHAALQTSESELIAFAGLDAAIYVRFLKTGVLITLLSMVYCLLVIVPLAATDDGYFQNNKNVKDADKLEFTTFDTLSMGNINKKSDRLWGCMIGVFWVSGVVYYVLYQSYVWVTSVRARFQAHAVERPEQYVVLVRDIPSSKTEDDVDSFFRQLHPDSYEKCLIIRDLSKASKAYAALEKAKASLSHAEGTFLRSRSERGTSPVVKRPQHKTGFLGLSGTKVDSIDYWTDRIRNELVPKLEEEQRAVGEDKSSQGAAFVFFKTRRDAAMAAQTMHAQDANSWVVSEAPEAREVVFVNLHRSWYQRIILQISSVALVTAMILFYAIPIGFISGFTTLANLQKQLSFIKYIPKSVKTILEAFLPTLAIRVFTAILPMICIMLSTLEGLPSQSQISRAAAGKYFSFNVLNIFLIVAIGGSAVGIIKQVGNAKDKLSTVSSLLGSSLAQNASFWVVFVALSMFAGWGFNLLRIGPLAIYHLKKRFLCKTDKEERAAWEPGQVEYHTGVPAILLVFTITLVYAVIAPMILPFGFVFFFLGYLVTVHQVMNVNVAKDFESQGRMWPHIHHRILAALLLSQVVCLCYFVLKVWFYTVFLIVPPVLTIIFYYYCNRKFYHSFEHLALRIAAEEAKQVPTLSQLTDSFTPPCMVPDESLEDATFDDARSDALSSAGLSSDGEDDGGKSKRLRGSFRKV